MFYPPEALGFVSVLRRHAETISAEYAALRAEDFVPQTETDLYTEGGWLVVPFFIDRDVPYVQERCRIGRALCPQTAELLASIPGCIMATLSMMTPGARIHPHHGFDDSYYRCHLCLREAPDCAIEVGGEVRTWRTGEFVVFEDTVEHSAWNRGTEARVVLMADFRKADWPLPCP